MLLVLIKSGVLHFGGFFGGLGVKNHLIRDLGSVPGSRRSPGEGNGNPFQYSWLENSVDRGAWRATVYGVARVRHDLVTKSPPSLTLTKFLPSCSTQRSKKLTPFKCFL